MTDGLPAARLALADLAAVFERIPDATLETFCTELLAARRIACHGAGREGLMIRALAMRLFHLGLDSHVVGDMTTPPLGEGDLLVATCGPGHVPTVLAFLDVARAAGARGLAVTAVPGAEVARHADVLIHLPAQTMASDVAEPASTLPMGTLFEIAELLFFDLAALRLRELTGQDAATMRARHTNLE